MRSFSYRSIGCSGYSCNRFGRTTYLPVAGFRKCMVFHVLHSWLLQVGHYPMSSNMPLTSNQRAFCWKDEGFKNLHYQCQIMYAFPSLLGRVLCGLCDRCLMHDTLNIQFYNECMVTYHTFSCSHANSNRSMRSSLRIVTLTFKRTKCPLFTMRTKKGCRTVLSVVELRFRTAY